jgi:uncharacterized damage-inducible protein DinB
MNLPLDIELIPSYYKSYVNRVIALELMDALRVSHQELLQLIDVLPESKSEYRYQTGKWSIKEVLCHLIDAERIFSYRALRFARNDKTELHGFDDNHYVAEANTQSRILSQIIEEIKHLRVSTIDLFSSFSPAMLQRVGKANNTELSVLAIGYIIAGHEMHHRALLEERYHIG